MKKIISVVLALTMLATLGLTAFAADITDTAPEGQEVIVKTAIDPDANPAWYVVKIPTTPSVIAWGTTDAVDVGYEVACQLDAAKKLTVSIASTNGDVMTSTATADTIAYTPAGFAATDFAAVTGTGTAAAPANFAAHDATITIAATAWQGIAIAEYADTLTFTAEVLDA